MRCKECGRGYKRSNPQNARLHKLLCEISARLKAKDGEYHHYLWWKVMFKHQYLGVNEYRRPDGQVIYDLKSTADLTTDEFTEFMNKVELYANERGVYLDE